MGWDHEHRIIVDLAERIQDCGAEALTIHGRTRCQMYTGEADWELIGAVKQNPRMHIPNYRKRRLSIRVKQRERRSKNGEWMP